MSGKKNRKWEHSVFALMLSFSSPHPTGKFLPASHTFSPLSRPPKSFSLGEKFCPRPSLQSCWLPCCNSPSIFFFLQPLMGPVPSPSLRGWKESGITFKNKNYLETKMWWKDLSGALPRCWGSHYVVNPPSLLWTLLCSQFCLTK